MKKSDLDKNFEVSATPDVIYEMSKINTAHLIKETGSRDAWTLAKSPKAPTDLKRFLSMLDAALIIMNNPSLID